MRNPCILPVAPVALMLALTCSSRFLARATEVDNFTSRDRLTRDALPVFDQKVNTILSRAVRLANRESPDRCSRVLLRQEIVRWTGPDPVGILELWATLSDDLERSPVGLKDSVYKDATLSDAPAMRVFGIGRSFKLAGHVIGTDKIGHFFMQGLDYYKRVSLDGADLTQVMRFENNEDGIWGLKTSGVRSYADMAANFAGYKFWSELYQGEKPYVRCEGGRKWAKVRDFTWADYVTDAWDEAINCSEMKPALEARVERQLSGMGIHCPIDPPKCQELSKLEKAEYYVSPACRGPLASASIAGPAEARP